MKLHILTTEDLDLTEFKQFTGWDVTVKKTTKKIPKQWNPFFNQWWGDFDWIRANTPKGYDARGYVTSWTNAKALGINTHMGMYDLLDKDGVLDFYILPPKGMQKATKENDFKSNVTRLLVHELCHGKVQLKGVHDATHAMEEQGMLKEYWSVLAPVERPQTLLIKALTQLVALYTQLLNMRRLQPLVERRANRVMERMEMLGHSMRIVDGYRSKERQDELYAQGRTSAGNIVTNAKGGESLHNFGVAVDCVFRREGYDAPKALWQTFGKIAKEEGFEWGGDWPNFKDYPHIQMPLGHSIEEFQKGKVDYKIYK
jgi:peptidoglycan LD-endopeptidase CwlK